MISPITAPNISPPKKNNIAGIHILCYIIGRGDMIRTRDILDPNQALYQAELRPDVEAHIYIKKNILQVFFYQICKKFSTVAKKYLHSDKNVL